MNQVDRKRILAELNDAAKPFGKRSDVFTPFAPTNRNISWLFRRYDLCEMTEHFYDEGDLDRVSWIDVTGPGVWLSSQPLVNRQAKRALKRARSKVRRNGRFYIAFLDEHAFIYYYGRDRTEMDYWWIFVRKNKWKR